MRIRLTGTSAEIDAAVAVLRTVLQVREVSPFYPNRGASLLGRVYLDVLPPPGVPTAADPAGSGR